MAAARQKEMKVNITVVATKTLTAGRWRFPVVVDIAVLEVPEAARGRRAAREAVYQCTAFTASSWWCTG